MSEPLISVVVEGYNESLAQGSSMETLECLARQHYPTNRVEVILVGSEEQAAFWRESLGNERRFFRVMARGVAGAHYYRLKNLGAQSATGDILAFTDSDALPEIGWLRSIASAMTNGADAVAGISLFRWKEGSERWPGLLTVAAAISWGFVVGHPPRGFLNHNVAFRRSVFDAIGFREDLGRTCAGSFLYDSMVREGLDIRFGSDQRVRHTFTMRWWLTRLHVRFGYESYLLRRLNEHDAYRWVKRLGILEPLATMVWRVLLDVPQWFRFSKGVGWHRGAQVAYVPLVVLLSMAARGAEAAGMLATLAAPDRMRRFALEN